MRTGTTLVQRFLSTSPVVNPTVTECHYLTSQMDLYAHSMPKYDLILKDYFGSPANFELYTQQLVREFLLTARIRLNPDQTLVIKNPELSPHIPTLAKWLPDARFIISIRDPRDTIMSIANVGERHRKSGVDSPLATMDRDMLKLSNFYKSYYAAIVNQSAGIQSQVLFVRYEDLVKRTSDTIRALSEFCGLEIDDSRLDDQSLTGKKSAVEADPYTAAFWSPLYEEGVSTRQVGHYVDGLSSTEIELIQQHCADFNAIFPYW